MNSTFTLGGKETTEFGPVESVVLQLTEKLNGSFYCILFDNFFTWPSFFRKLADTEKSTKLETSIWNPKAKALN